MPSCVGSVRKALIGLFGLLGVVSATGQPQHPWWTHQPIRLIQTNLRETDSGLDPERLVRQLEEFRANVLLLNMGGIVAQYPTQVPFHYPSPYIPPGRDPFGEVLRLAHRRGIRVIGRFDFSRTLKPVFDAHPEWFFRKVNGEPAIYNGLYTTCINGGYYREHVFQILEEALTRYEVDGLFFNMFGNPSRDYSGNRLGPCHCGACQRKFRAEYGRTLPEDDNDPQYREFLQRSASEVARQIASLIRRLRPQAAFATYIHEHVDWIMSESNTAVDRPLPLWPYSASDNVIYARCSEPGKLAVNLSMSFVDYPWRFASVPPEEIRIRLQQAMAHGGALAQNMHGTMDQEDRTFLEPARRVFAWHAAHEEYYVGQEHAGRVLLVGTRSNAYRGLFRLLSEEHIPFQASNNYRWLAEHPEAFDLVIATSPPPASLEAWVRRGGRLLVIGPEPPPFGIPKPIRRWEDVRGYFRIRDHRRWPSLRDTRLTWLYGPYLELPPVAEPLLTLIPPSMFGPPEKVFTDAVETDKPGVWLGQLGQGQMVYVPWDIGTLYYRHSSHTHAGLLRDLIDGLLPQGRQLIADAHPLVEISLMRQPARRRLLIHLINLSGHSQTAYFPPLVTGPIRISVVASFARARSLRLGRFLRVQRRGQYGEFVLPRLEDFDTVVLEPE